jgi:Leucine-rich repeat (LRR) protein
LADDFWIKFSELEVLDLSFNRFNSTLPAGISSMRKIKRLNISNNKFFGSLDNLLLISNTIEYIEFQNNIFSGEIPVMRNYANLKVLDLRNNTLTGVFSNDYLSINIFPNLIYFGIMFNEVIGPEICKNTPLCPLKTFDNLRSIDDPDFKLSSDDLMYLLPR